MIASESDGIVPPYMSNKNQKGDEMLIIRMALSLIAISFLAFVICGCAHEANIRRDLIESTGDDSYWRDKKSRQIQAERWRQEFTNLNAQLPTLSPEERHWLEVEIDDQIAGAGGRYTERALRAMGSREYALRVAKPHAEQIVKTLDDICSSKAVDLANETRLWTKIASLFMDLEFWQAIDNLRQRNVVQDRSDWISKLDYENHVLWAQQILNEIVIRYFRGDLGQ